MKCTVCNRDRPMPKIHFQEDGMVPLVMVKKYNAVCADCLTAPTREPDTLTRVPGEDDEDDFFA